MEEEVTANLRAKLLRGKLLRGKLLRMDRPLVLLPVMVPSLDTLKANTNSLPSLRTRDHRVDMVSHSIRHRDLASMDHVTECDVTNDFCHAVLRVVVGDVYSSLLHVVFFKWFEPN
jgi:hypothetical protein